MAYKAKDGRSYSHKETPSEYRARKGLGSASPACGCVCLILIAAAIGVVQEFWPLFVGVAVLGAAAYAIRRSIYKKPTWKCPKCNVTMPLSDVQDTGGAGHCPMCAHVALYPEPRGMCPYCGTGGVAYKAKICHKCHKAFL